MARPLYIVTGADWTHARSLLQLLNSVNAAEPAIAVVVYDLGLTKEQLQSVRSTMTRARLERFRFPPARPDEGRPVRAPADALGLATIDSRIGGTPYSKWLRRNHKFLSSIRE